MIAVYSNFVIHQSDMINKFESREICTSNYTVLSAI